MVEMTKEDKKIYGLYLLLRKYAPNVNIVTLRQISLYVARSTDDFDVNRDCSIILNGSNERFELLLKDGRKIVFLGDEDKMSFTVLKEDQNASMLVNVYETVSGDLITANVYGEVRTKDDGMFIISFRPNNIADSSLKFGVITYYSVDEVNWVSELASKKDNDMQFDILAKENLVYPFAEKSYFDLQINKHELDCFKGYISDVLNRVDLLYDNMNVYVKTKTRKKNK